MDHHTFVLVSMQAHTWDHASVHVFTEVAPHANCRLAVVILLCRHQHLHRYAKLQGDTGKTIHGPEALEDHPV